MYRVYSEDSRIFLRSFHFTVNTYNVREVNLLLTALQYACRKLQPTSVMNFYAGVSHSYGNILEIFRTMHIMSYLNRTLALLFS